LIKSHHGNLIDPCGFGVQLQLPLDSDQHDNGHKSRNGKKQSWDVFSNSIWRPWTGVQGTKAEPVEGEHLLYSFLTSEPYGVVGPIHPKAMLVIFTAPEEYETWLTPPAGLALKLQRPLPDDMLQIVAEGARSDQPEAA
jgi:putative SOS response-associated peptidase YedK